MELLETLANRRSVRKYKEEPVSREVLEQILEAACMAPSAENMQPWYFVALTQQEDILLMQETMERSAHFDQVQVNFCINYGGRDEIIRAVKQYAADVAAGKRDPSVLQGDHLARSSTARITLRYLGGNQLEHLTVGRAHTGKRKGREPPWKAQGKER